MNVPAICTKCGNRDTIALANAARYACPCGGDLDIDDPEEHTASLHTAAPVMVELNGRLHHEYLTKGFSSGRTMQLGSGKQMVFLIPPGSIDDQADYAIQPRWVPDWQQLPDIPDAVPQEWVNEQPDRLRVKDLIRSRQRELVHAGLAREGVATRVKVRFKADDPWAFLSDALGSVSADSLVLGADGYWSGTLIVPPEQAVDAMALNDRSLPMAASKTADFAGTPSGKKCKDCGLPATKSLLGHDFCDDHYYKARARIVQRESKTASTWGIFNSDDQTLVYGPTTQENVEAAYSSGRYSNGAYYAGTMPDNRELQSSVPVIDTEPFGTGQSESSPVYEPAHSVTSVFERRAAKVDEIAEGVMVANPGMERRTARKLAVETLHRYPQMVVASSRPMSGERVQTGDGEYRLIDRVLYLARPDEDAWLVVDDSGAELVVVDNGSSGGQNEWRRA